MEPQLNKLAILILLIVALSLLSLGCKKKPVASQKGDALAEGTPDRQVIVSLNSPEAPDTRESRPQDDSDIVGWDQARWGMTEDEVRHAFGERAEHHEPVSYAAWYSTIQVAGVYFGEVEYAADMLFGKGNRQLSGINIRPVDASKIADGDLEFSRISKVLELKYGPPTKSDTTSSIWSFPSTTVKASHVTILAKSDIGIYFRPGPDYQDLLSQQLPSDLVYDDDAAQFLTPDGKFAVTIPSGWKPAQENALEVPIRMMMRDRSLFVLTQLPNPNRLAVDSVDLTQTLARDLPEGFKVEAREEYRTKHAIETSIYRCVIDKENAPAMNLVFFSSPSKIYRISIILEDDSQNQLQKMLDHIFSKETS